MATTPAANNRILVVEDDPAIRRLMTTHFRRNGFNVEYAMSAEEVAPDEPYDLVLTDVHLPGASGLDLAKRIRETQPQQHVVFMTGDSDESVAREAIDTGAAGYLLKPFEFFELDAVVSNVLRGDWSKPKPIAHAHVTKAAPILYSPRAAERRSSLRSRLKIAAATVVMTAAAWGTGAFLADDEAVPVETAQVLNLGEPNHQTMVPIVIDKTVYLNP